MNLVEALNSDYTPLTGRDIVAARPGRPARHFYSHAPRGARPQNLVVYHAATSIS